MGGSRTGTPVTEASTLGPALSTSGGCYARPADLKNYLGITATTDDVVLLLCCEWARAQIDSITRRHFYPHIATRYYDADVPDYYLPLGDDLITLTTFTNGDTTTILAANYRLYPVEGPPYQWIELNKAGSVNFTYSTTPQRAMSILGVWGWSKVGISSGATAAVISTTSTTTITPSSLTDFRVGDLIEIDNEMMYARVKGSTLTVVRGFNGSTAATHLALAAINFVRFEDEIMWIATRLAAWRYKQKDAPFALAGNTMGGITTLGNIAVPAEIPGDILKDLMSWVRS